MELEKDVKNPPDSAEESARGKYFFIKKWNWKKMSPITQKPLPKA